MCHLKMESEVTAWYLASKVLEETSQKSFKTIWKIEKVGL